MPRGRTSRKAAILRRAVSSCFEPLESRRMLTTLQGGDTFVYQDSNDELIRISLSGDIVAEFLAMRVYDGTNRQVILDLQPPLEDAPDNYGADLFHIYIVDARPNAVISISRIDDDGNPQPYDGNVGDIRVIPKDGGESVTITPTGGGQVYIGARTKDYIDNTDDEQDVPITFANYRSDFGLRPSSRGIYAGIETAPGVNMGKILIGGTITGRVFIGGQLETLYAGDLLLGDTRGTFRGSSSELPNNLFVGGDLRNLLVRGSLGTDPEGIYRTGTDIRVGGKLGNIKVANQFDAVVEVVNNPELPLNNAPFEEVEYTLLGGEKVGDVFMRGDIADEFVSNNALTNRFFGSSFTSSLTGKVQGLDFAGRLNSNRGDSVDYYSVPLMAGQTVTVQLYSPDPFLNGLLNVGIFDPLGRFIKSDLADFQGGGGGAQAFRFTAEMPGIYQFAVAGLGDQSFGGSYVPANADPVSASAFGDYNLIIQDYGEVAFGGASIGGATRLDDQDTGLFVRRGDLGAWDSVGDFLANLFTPINLLKGNLRHLGGEDIGGTVADSTVSLASPDLLVPRGSVGMIKSTGNLFINPNAFNLDDPVASNAVGFDYQWIEVGGNFSSQLTANRAIHVIRVTGDINSSAFLPRIYANADRRGEDGRIDLIDVTGNFGDLVAGGPALYTGLRGNIKYIRVGGTVFNDYAFGRRIDVTQTYPLGRTVTLQDDSGAQFSIIPDTYTTTTTDNGTTTTVRTPTRVTVTAYPVREAAGQVIIKLTLGGGATFNSRGGSGQVDIGEIESQKTDATPLVYNATRDTIEYEGSTDTTTQLTPTSALDFRFNGRVPINVMSIQAGTGRLSGGLGSISSITNYTSGEISGIRAQSIGSVIAQRVGILTGTGAVKPVALTSNFDAEQLTYPFDATTFGVFSTGPIRQILSRDELGAVYAGAEIGEIRANADGKNSLTSIEGITRPVRGTRIINVNVGEGLLHMGTGDIVGGGIYATDSIKQIVANNADIRGVINAGNYIETIVVRDGSIQNARISTFADVTQTAFYNRQVTITDTESAPPPATNPSLFVPRYGLKTLSVSGNGGIIGSAISVGDFENIYVDGFGILESRISAIGLYNPSGRIVTTGLGIRGTSISAGFSVNTVQAVGDGQLLDVKGFNISVRQSERNRYDAQSGRTLDATNDLHRYLGTSAGSSRVSGITNAGIIEDTDIAGTGQLRKLEAYLIRDGADNLITRDNVSYPMRVYFAQSIDSIKAKNAIMGLRVVTGKLNSLNAGGNMQEVAVDVSGQIGEVVSGRTIRGTVNISAKGPQGSINRVYARSGMYASIESATDINQIQVGSLGGDPSLGVRALGKIGELRIVDDVVTGTYVRASKGMNTLFVGGDIQSGVKISARSYGTVTILGTNNGQVVVE